MTKHSSKGSSQKSAMTDMKKNNNNKKAGIICGFFPESDTEPYPEGKPSITNKTNHW